MIKVHNFQALIDNNYSLYPDNKSEQVCSTSSKNDKIKKFDGTIISAKQPADNLSYPTFSEDAQKLSPLNLVSQAD